MGNYKAAVATSDDIVVNQHFGRASRFQIYEVDENNNPKLLEIREVIPVCEGGDHSDERLRAAAENFRDCQYIIVSRIGPGAFGVMAEEGIIVFEFPDMIDSALKKLIRFLETEKLKADISRSRKAGR